MNDLIAFDESNLIESLDLGRETTVHTQNRVVDDGRYGQIVEKFAARLPRIGITVLVHAFVVEAVHLRNLTWLVIAAQQRDSVRVFGFE